MPSENSPQANKKFYIAFASSSELYRKSIRFLDVFQNQSDIKAAPLLADLLYTYIPEVMDALLKKPTDLAQLGKTAQKIVDISASTLLKTSNLLVKQLLKNIKNKDLIGLQEHVALSVIHAHESDKGVHLSGIEISEALFDKALILIGRMEHQLPSTYHDEVVELLMEVTEAIINEVMRKPVTLLPLGPVLKKVANLGMDTILATVMKVVKNVFAKMNDDQYKAVGYYFKELLVQAEKSTQGI